MRERLPQDAIVGEELGASQGNDRIWVFDPIDGTSAMVLTALADAFDVPLSDPVPAFGITIAVVHGEHARVGVVGELRPAGRGLALARIWVGYDGQPTLCNGAPVAGGPPTALTAATLASTVPEVMFATTETWSGFQALRDATAAIETDQNCIGFMRLLGGGIDVVVERDLTLPDAAALLPVLEGAGIVVSDHAGRGYGSTRRRGMANTPCWRPHPACTARLQKRCAPGSHRRRTSSSPAKIRAAVTPRSSLTEEFESG